MKSCKTATLEAVADYGNLLVAHANARRGKSFYTSVKEFETNKVELLHQLSESLLDGSYRTSEYRHQTIFDSGKFREISKLPYYPDRIVHWAIMLQLEPTFMKRFSPRSHAAIGGRGIHSALRQTRSILRDKKNSKYCYKIDISKYFPHVNHCILKEQVDTMTKDRGLLKILYEIIDSVPEEMGLPIGNYLSQYFANLYLTKFDKWLEELLIKITGNPYFVRYMDDIIIFSGDKYILRKVMREVEWYLRRNLYLEIKDNWQIYPVESRGVDFVGYVIYPNRVLPRKSIFGNMRKLSKQLYFELRNCAVYTLEMMGRLFAIMGWLIHCTKKVRISIYVKYLKRIFDMGKINMTTKMKSAFTCL